MRIRVVPLLSTLIIDVDKDWKTRVISNLGAPTAAKEALRYGDEGLIDHQTLLNYAADRHLILPAHVAVVLDDHDLARHPLGIIPTIPLSTKVSEHDLTRHPLGIIPAMDDAHIPDLEGLGYGGPFAADQEPITTLPTDYRQGIETYPEALREHLSTDGAIGQNSRAHFLAVLIPHRMTVTRIKIYVTTQAGNIDVGIYDKDGTRLVSTGSTGCPATGHQIIEINATTLDPGLHFLAIAGDDSTVAFSYAPTDSDTGKASLVNGCFPLPATMPGSTDVTQLYWMEVL